MTLLLVALAIASGLLGTLAARHVAWTLRIVNHPNPIVPQHTRSTAYLGGLGIAGGAGVVITVALGLGIPVLAAPLETQLAFAVGALAFLALGTFDDVRPLRPGGKLLAQLSIALLVARFGHPLAGPLELAASTLWIAVVVNAVNLTDVCDGLVASLSIVSLLALAITSAVVAPVTLILAGTVFGFLRFNRSPASIFLGDGGSHLLGFAIAEAWLVALHADGSWNRAAAALLGVAVFVFELGFLVIVRHKRRIPFWRGSPDHLALRLQAAGHSKTKTVMIALIPAAGFAVLAVWLARSADVVAVGCALVALAVLVAAVARLYAMEPVPKAGRSREEPS